jgi:hypothetical protein
VPEPAPWKLDGFLDRLDAWAERESPDADLRLHVTGWVMNRHTDPYQGARRERDFPNLWFGVVPGSEDGQGNVVVCLYSVDELEHVVQCVSIATLSWPV